MAQMTFNAAQFTPSTGGGVDVVETGEYGLRIVSSDVKETKKKDGYFLELGMEVLNPEGARGKRLAQRLNVQNPSADAVRIAMEELSAICHVVGVMSFQDTQQLHGRPFMARITKDARKDDPEKFENNIRAYMDVNGNAPAAQGAAPAAAPAAPAMPGAAPAAAPAAPPAAAPAAAPAPTPAAPAAPPAATEAAAPAAGAGAPPGWAEPAPGTAPAAGGTAPPWATS